MKPRLRLERARLYLVLEARPHGKDPSELLDAALRGGVDVVQLRDKDLPDDELVRAAEPFRRACDAHGALFVLNDRPDLVTKMIRATQRSLRLIRNDRKYAIEFIKGPYLDLGKDRNRFADRIYDAALQYNLQTGTVDEKLQREMIAVAAQRVKPKELPPPERVFDFSFAQKVADTMK